MVFDDKRLFLLYGIVNILLITFLIILVILFFNNIHLFRREIFVLVIALQIGFFFIVRIHYVVLGKDEKKKVIKLSYQKKFSYQGTLVTLS